MNQLIAFITTGFHENCWFFEVSEITRTGGNDDLFRSLHHPKRRLLLGKLQIM
jgi:hypothetical protein